jgi:hypothetical protein
VLPPENNFVNNRWSQDDEKTEEEQIGCFLESDFSGKAYDGEEEEKGTEKKEKCMSEFKKEKEKSVFFK